MSRRLVPSAILAAAVMAGALGGPAQGQVRRVQNPQPQLPPGFQAPDFNPVMQKLNALQAEVNALRQSAGRQVVVLHYTPTETGGWTDAENTFPQNNQRAVTICQAALGDRYGRVLSRTTQWTGSRFYFAHLVCETKP